MASTGLPRASVCILAGDDGKPMVCVLPASDPELGLYDDGLVLMGQETYADKRATTAAMVRPVEGHSVALSARDTELLLVTERWLAVFDGCATSNVASSPAPSACSTRSTSSLSENGSTGFACLGGSRQTARR